MKVIVEILEQNQDRFPTKRGETVLEQLVCVDRTPEGRLMNTFDYVMSADEFQKHNGKISGKTAELVLKEIEQSSFSKRLRAKGSILSVK